MHRENSDNKMQYNKYSPLLFFYPNVKNPLVLRNAEKFNFEDKG